MLSKPAKHPPACPPLQAACLGRGPCGWHVGHVGGTYGEPIRAWCTGNHHPLPTSSWQCISSLASRSHREQRVRLSSTATHATLVHSCRWTCLCRGVQGEAVSHRAVAGGNAAMASHPCGAGGRRNLGRTFTFKVPEVQGRRGGAELCCWAMAVRVGGASVGPGLGRAGSRQAEGVGHR